MSKKTYIFFLRLRRYPSPMPLPNMRNARGFVEEDSPFSLPADVSEMIVSGFDFFTFFVFGFFGFFAFLGFFFSDTTCMVNVSLFEIPGEFL